jgi:hypothetical protein
MPVSLKARIEQKLDHHIQPTAVSTSKNAFRPQPPKPLGKQRALPPFMQAVAFQFVLFQDIMNPKTTIKDRCLAARAWEILERLKRDIKMKPRPQPVDVATTIPSKKMTRFEEPAEAVVQSSEPAAKQPAKAKDEWFEPPQ